MRREDALFVFDGGSDDGAVIGAADVDDDVVAAAHADGLADVLDGLPSVGGLVFVVVVNLLDVDVLRVAVERGESPGDVAVVAGGDEGRAGVGDSGDMEVRAVRSGGFEIDLVPDVGDGVGDVHVVGHEGFSGGGMGSGDGPFVGADGAAVAGIVAEGFAELEQVLGVWFGIRRGGRRGFFLGRGEVGDGGGGWMVAPGADGVEAGGESGAELGEDLFVFELG